MNSIYNIVYHIYKMSEFEMRKMMNLEEIVFHTEIRQENLRLKQRVKELEEKIHYLNKCIADKCGSSSDALKKKLKKVGLLESTQH